MKRTQKAMRNAIVYGALALGIYTSPVVAAEPKASAGYNALEIAAAAKARPDGSRPVRDRLITNLSLSLSGLEMGYHGLNETNDWDSNEYFGRNRLMLGKEGFPLKALADTKADKDGVFDTKFGVRYTGLMEKIGCYGEIDLSANSDAANLSVFCGRPLGKGFSVELLQDTTVSPGQKPSYYTELQLNKDITSRLAVFSRAEFPGFEMDKAIYLIGLAFNMRCK